MPRPKNVKITVKKTEVPSPADPTVKVATVTITISENPVNLKGHGMNAPINWSIDDPDGQGWEFDDDGIVLKGNWGSFFVNEGADATRKIYTVRRMKDDNKKYDYLISVTDNTSRITWDPSIINYP